MHRALVSGLAAVGLVVACRADPPAAVQPPVAVVPAPVAAPAAPQASVIGAAAATSGADDECRSDDDCVLSTFPGCCPCCDCAPVHAVARNVDKAQRDACARKDCKPCDRTNVRCMPCRDPAKEGMHARCRSGACVLVET